LPISDSTEYVGRTEAVSFVDLRARVTGFLVKRSFEEGADVREGDLLYVIEQEPYRAAVDIAEASVEQAEATQVNAEKYLERLNTVRDSGGTSKANLDAAEQAVVENRAVLKERRARLVQAELNLGYTEIRAPISGRIGRTSVHVGNLVGPDSGVLATIVRMDPIWVTFPVSEREFLQLLNGEKVRTSPESAMSRFIPTLRLVDGSQYPHRGTVDYQDNRVDKATGTITLRATFPNPGFFLRPGQFVTVIQTERQSRERLLVPQAAVQRDQVGPFVLTVDAQKKAEVRRIQLEEEYGSDWIVKQGLNAGEWVVSDGLQKVTPGAEVNPSPASAPESSEGKPSAQ